MPFATPFRNAFLEHLLHRPLLLLRLLQRLRYLQGEDFHRMLTVARLTALSHGDGTVTEAHWNHMKTLEAQVAERVRSAGRVSPTTSKAGPLNVIPEDA